MDRPLLCAWSPERFITPEAQAGRVSPCPPARMQKQTLLLWCVAGLTRAYSPGVTKMDLHLWKGRNKTPGWQKTTAQLHHASFPLHFLLFLFTREAGH